MQAGDEPITIRKLDRKTDRAGVEAIDTSFETRTVLDVTIRARRIELVEYELAQPMTKRYSIGSATSCAAPTRSMYGSYMPGESAIYLAKRL